LDTNRTMLASSPELNIERLIAEQGAKRRRRANDVEEEDKQEEPR
jgi:hypothetical protein